MRKTFLTVGAALLACQIFSLAASAQTGPVGPSQPPPPKTPQNVSPPGQGTGPINTPTTQPGTATVPAKRFDAPGFGNYLRQHGYKVEEKPASAGQHVFLTTVEKNGWRFVVEFSLLDNSSQVNIYCYIGNPLTPGKATVDRLLHLMEISRTTIGGQGFFTYRDSDRRLILYDYCAANPTVFGPYLDRVLQDARNTYAAWNWAA